MLRIKRRIESCGLVIPLRIMVSQQKEIRIRSRGREVPKPIDATALVDTGADWTIVDPEIILALRLIPTDECELTYLETGATEIVPSVGIDVMFIDGEHLSTRFTTSAAVKCLGRSEYSVLLGRDMLQHCVLSYDGHENEAVIEV